MRKESGSCFRIHELLERGILRRVQIVLFQLLDERDIAEFGELVLRHAVSVHLEVCLADDLFEGLLQRDESDRFVLRILQDQVDRFDQGVGGFYFRFERLRSTLRTWNAASSFIRKSEKCLYRASIGSIFLKNLTDAEKTQKSENLFCGARLMVWYLLQKLLKRADPMIS